METINKSLEFECCFCGKDIEPNEIDPCNINVLATFDRPEKDKPSQDFYCHFKCLKNRLHENISGYFMETNFQ